MAQDLCGGIVWMNSVNLYDNVDADFAGDAERAMCQATRT